MLRMMRLVMAGWLVVSAVPAPLAEPGRAGVLVVAHGGQPVWNERVREVVAEAQLGQPVEVVFGMGMAAEVPAWQEAVRRLDAQGTERLVVVPLLVSSHSEVYRQIAYLFNQRPDPAPELTDRALQPIETDLDIELRRGLDDNRLVAEILLERARTISRQPPAESVVLVAHGPVGDEDNQEWLETIAKHAQFVMARGGFQQVVGVTLRDDAPTAIRGQATRELRRIVEELGQRGRVIVVPLLISEGGIEHGIRKRLEGLSYEMVPQGLLPHPKMAEWIRRQVAGPAD